MRPRRPPGLDAAGRRGTPARMKGRDRIELLFGPHRPSRLREGGRAACPAAGGILFAARPGRG